MNKFSGSKLIAAAALALTTALIPVSGRTQQPAAAGPAAAAAVPATPASPATVRAAASNAALAVPGSGRQDNSSQLSQPALCRAPASMVQLGMVLRNLARRLNAGEPIKIVAIGSSSTAGAMASSPAASYPSKLAVELKRRFPQASITVLNRGVNGEEAADMLKRLDRDVVAEHPDLVLWQVGTNAVLRDHSVDGAARLIHEGLMRLKATGADVVLIDPQYSPRVLAKGGVGAMVNVIAAAAKQDNVGLFHRFAVMRHWREDVHIGFDSFVSPDGLHMNDWSYGCWAKLLGGAIAEAISPVTAVAGTKVEAH